MNRSELKTLRPGDIVYDKRSGKAYEYVKTEPFYYRGQLIGYDLVLKGDVRISSKRVRK